MKNLGIFFNNRFDNYMARVFEWVKIFSVTQTRSKYVLCCVVKRRDMVQKTKKHNLSSLFVGKVFGYFYLRVV